MENCLNPEKYSAEAGIDEAGRGSLAGPVCVSAVILPKDLEVPEKITIRDSKKLSEKKRKAAAEWIKENALAWSAVFVGVEDIDKLNILNATFLGMRKAIEELSVEPDFLTIDGPYFQPKHIDIQYQCISGGDDKYRNIAAASIIAKTTRDEYMIKLHEECPQYKWNKNKAYGTKEHKAAIKEFGVSKYHRTSFNTN
tara:strand:- start:3136 stop:3726 length:591 start_codon:yes stop_codon:yes gene_type:complete